MSMLIKPLSAISVADDPEINAANYPALKLAINAQSVVASNQLDSLVGGLVQYATALEAFTVDAGGDFFNFNVGSTLAGAGNAGVIPGPLDTQKVLMIYVGGLVNNTSKVTVGSDTNTPALSFGLGTGTAGAGPWTGVDGSNYHNPPSLTKTGFVGDHGVLAGVWNLSANAGKFYALDSSSYEDKATAVAAGTINSNWGNLSTAEQAKLGLPTEVDVYGLYLFYLSELPSDDEIKAIIGWMYANPTRLYPGLAGRA